MEDIDFKQCEFIRQDMSYINYFDFCDNCFSIKNMYQNLDKYSKRFYKWYVYSNIHMQETYKNAIWNYLNSDEPEYFYKFLAYEC